MISEKTQDAFRMAVLSILDEINTTSAETALHLKDPTLMNFKFDIKMCPNFYVEEFKVTQS